MRGPTPARARSAETKVLPLIRPPGAPRVPAVVCQDVTKRFYIYEHRAFSMRELFVRTVLRKPTRTRGADFTLKPFSLQVERGESIALVGSNGSGKSTALRLIAGIYQPTSGHVMTHGRIAAIIDLGVGFHSDLTGVENVFQHAAAIGLRRREIRERLDEVLDFADLGDFVHEPIRFYSTGMRARLAFACAMICGQPDILLMDEVLSVGDHEFQERCIALLREFRARGGTLIVVSHGDETLRELCERAVWLERGEIRMVGPTSEVLGAYTGAPRSAVVPAR